MKHKFEVALWFANGERTSGFIIARHADDAEFKFMVRESRRRGLKSSLDLHKLLEPDGVLVGRSSVPMTRAELIESGRVWQVWTGEGAAAKDLFEGTRTACERWLKDRGLFKRWKNGSTEIHFGQLIAEK